MSKLDEEKWQADMDAHTLAEAKIIEKDKGRFKRAEKAANSISKEAQEKATAMKNVSSDNSRKTSKSISGSKKRSSSKPINPLLKGIPGKRR